MARSQRPGAPRAPSRRAWRVGARRAPTVPPGWEKASRSVRRPEGFLGLQARLLSANPHGGGHRVDFMARALELAERALGVCSPNPAVGAVVVKDGRILGEGWTKAPGEGHAEVVALQRAGAAAAGATLY